MLNNELFWVALGSIATAVGSIATGVGLILTAKGLRYTAEQLKESKKIARGEFLLNLDAALAQHTEVHMFLRRGGKWADKKSGPETQEEWGKTERYMGLFERIYILIKDGILDFDSVNRLYGYRVLNINANPVIRKEKLTGPTAGDWQYFINLLDMIKKHQHQQEDARQDTQHPISSSR